MIPALSGIQCRVGRRAEDVAEVGLRPGWLGPAIPSGEILLEAYLKPLGLG